MKGYDYLSKDYCLVLLQVPKCFVPVQIFCVRPKIYSQLCLPQTFCPGPKDNLHSVKLVFCAGTKVFKDGLNAVKVFGLAKKIWTGTKHFGTCKRTRH